MGFVDGLAVMGIVALAAVFYRLSVMPELCGFEMTDRAGDVAMSKGAEIAVVDQGSARFSHPVGFDTGSGMATETELTDLHNGFGPIGILQAVAGQTFPVFRREGRQQRSRFMTGPALLMPGCFGILGSGRFP